MAKPAPKSEPQVALDKLASVFWRAAVRDVQEQIERAARPRLRIIVQRRPINQVSTDEVRE
jgi:hypothetical protein